MSMTWEQVVPNLNNAGTDLLQVFFKFLMTMRIGWKIY